MISNNFNWLKWTSEIQAIAQSGLTYSNNEFDKERYIRLKEIIAELSAHCSGNRLNDIANIFSLEKGYATPKIDGVDVTQYAVDPMATPIKDIFLPGVDYDILKNVMRSQSNIK